MRRAACGVRNEGSDATAVGNAADPGCCVPIPALSTIAASLFVIRHFSGPRRVGASFVIRQCGDHLIPGNIPDHFVARKAEAASLVRGMVPAIERGGECGGGGRDHRAGRTVAYELADRAG